MDGVERTHAGRLEFRCSFQELVIKPDQMDAGELPASI
jgi:hypothetical protein